MEVLELKKLLSAFAALMLILSLSFATAADYAVDEYVVELDDGAYMVCSIYENPSPQALSGTIKVKSGHLRGNIFTSDGDPVASVIVYGTFMYDGSSSEAISSSYGYEIHDDSWDFKSGSSDYEGATATATVTFEKFLRRDIVATVTLTCSPTGVLS